MNRRFLTYRFSWLLMTLLLAITSLSAYAQEDEALASRHRLRQTDSITIELPDSLVTEIPKMQWIPNPTKATWMALAFPGGGQIYNKKYWKLPIFYAGFAGCAYALTWNNRMYKDYSSAYKDAVNENWTAKSITDLIPQRYMERTSHSQVTELLRKRKDTYRRYRDISIFAFIGVYLLSVVDAYVDAELSTFDISPDLSMRVEPAVMDNGMLSGSGLKNQSVGLQCSLRF